MFDISKNNNKNIVIEQKGKKIIIKNISSLYQKTNILNVIKFKSELYEFNFKGKIINGDQPTLKIMSKTKCNILDIKLNEKAIIKFSTNKLGFLYMIVPPNSKFEFELFDYTNFQSETDLCCNYSKETLLVFNKKISIKHLNYFLQNNETLDVLCVNNNGNLTYDRVSDTDILSAPYYFLREILYRREYKKIITIGFDIDLVRSINKLDLHKSKVFFVVNNDLEYWDFPSQAKLYNCNKQTLSEKMIEEFNYLDKNILNFNNMNNYMFVFDDEQSKIRAEKLLNIKFNNFSYSYFYLYELNNSKIDARKSDVTKVLIIKRFDYHDINAFDIDIKLLNDLEEDKKLKNIEVTIMGEGNCFDVLTEPIKGKKNIKLIKESLSNVEKHLNDFDVLIYNTRGNVNNYLLFSAISNNMFVTGLVNNNDSINDYLYTDYDQFFQYFTSIIENNDKFIEDRKQLFRTVNEFIKSNKNSLNNCFVNDNNYFPITNSKGPKQPVLSIIIPAYNVQKYVKHTIWSLINQELAGEIEIVAINDGSTDNTLDILNEYQNEMESHGLKVLKVIDKPNGGHGSVINVGLQNITGKYVRLIDGDDTVDSLNLKLLIEKLINEDSDLVLNQYQEDWFIENLEVDIKLYEDLEIGKKYEFNKICLKKGIFDIYGPLLPTSTYKVDALNKRKFKITEKIFYDDMEWNYNAILNIETISYYDLNIYNHFIGRTGQSVTISGLKRHYNMHRIMTLNLINLYYDNHNINKNKLAFLEEKYVKKMIKTHYNICLNYFDNPKPFKQFNKELKKYKYFYNNEDIIIKKVNLYRISNGYIIYLNNFKRLLIKIKASIKIIYHKILFTLKRIIRH